MPSGFVHTELSTDDVGAAQRFYGALFDWKLRDLGPEMGHYVMIDTGDENSGGGIQGKQMPDQPSTWMPYVEVKSVEETISKAASLGAQIVLAYQEIGPMGAIGVFVDPQGAALGVWEKPPAPKKATSKKASSNKASSKKTASKKTASKKAASKKAASKKKAAKKASSNKASSKKASSKKASSKKASSKKASSKKKAAKKSAR